MFSGEHQTPEYKAINPTSTVPSLVDGDISVFESSAIAIYLVDKYAKEYSLYPKNLTERTKVNEHLFYVSSYLFPRIYQLFVPVYFRGATEFNKQIIEELHRGYGTIETFLNGNEYLSGNALTLADLYLWCIMLSLAEFVPIDKYPNFAGWLEKMKEHPSYAINKEGADEHIAFINKSLEKNRAAANDN